MGFCGGGGGQILGDGMKDRMWEAATRHARTCAPDGKVYAHATPHGTIFVDSIFNVVRVDVGGVEWPLQQLNRGQTVSPPPAPSQNRRSDEHELPLVLFVLTCTLVPAPADDGAADAAGRVRAPPQPPGRGRGGLHARRPHRHQRSAAAE
jgi:hypothetical protein